jgi:hypothetical protein
MAAVPLISIAMVSMKYTMEFCRVIEPLPPPVEVSVAFMADTPEADNITQSVMIKVWSNAFALLYMIFKHWMDEIPPIIIVWPEPVASQVIEPFTKVAVERDVEPPTR